MILESILKTKNYFTFSANTGETNMELVVLQININKGQNEELNVPLEEVKNLVD